MRKHILFHVALVAIVSSPAFGGSLYRCQQDGHVSYGDRACAGGVETRVEPAAAPPIDEQKVAVARLRQDLADFAARWAARFTTGSAAPGNATGTRPLATGAEASERETYCFERHDGADPTPTVRVTRHVTLSAIVRN